MTVVLLILAAVGVAAITLVAAHWAAEKDARYRNRRMIATGRYETLALSATNRGNWASEAAYRSAIDTLLESYADHHKPGR